MVDSAARVNVYDTFIQGAKRGFWTVVRLMPTLIGLMAAVGILRASGFLEFISEIIGNVTEQIGFPGALVPLTIVKMFSSSAATGLLLDHEKSPSRRTGELDNRGSHYYLAKYWAEALAAQDDDAELKSTFTPLAKALAENEEKIVAELAEVQGKHADIGGYYAIDPEKTKAVMRPSATLNQLLETI